MPHTAAVKILLFVSGFIILALEIMGARLMGPYTGITVPVWSALISITLTGSAVGYFLGGRLADRGQKAELLGGMVLCAAFFIAIIPVSRAVLEPIASQVSGAAGALIGAFALLFIPTAFLSAVITYAIRGLVESLETIGQAHGDLYGLATIGSAIGVFATSYLLVPLWTVSQILYGFSAVLLVLALVTSGLFRTSAN
jgi:hypothetical protein